METVSRLMEPDWVEDDDDGFIRLGGICFLFVFLHASPHDVSNFHQFDLLYGASQ